MTATAITGLSGPLDGSISRNHRRLDDACRRKVLDAAWEHGPACGRCGSRHLDVGDALEMGSIWPDEALGTYMAALTCRDCGARTGIRLRESEFLPG
ncbi:MAG: hypothetical protein ACRDN9_04940 [Streptosporangiaceae bacterium]